MHDDELLFADEHPPAAAPETEHPPWNILIVDDDEEVHTVTKLVLSNFSFAGRPLQFYSVYSATEGRDFLLKHDDVAVIFLDVVMEEVDSGLKLVHVIRRELQNQLVRIILRTGQPGHAPEARVIVDYDINDYKEKTELTSQKLITTLITALRSYRDLITIERNKNGLEQIVQSSPEIFRLQSLQNFAAGVLTQLSALLYLDRNSLYLKTASFAASSEENGFHILAATGHFSNEPAPPHITDLVRQRLQPALQEQRSVYADDHFVLYWRGPVAGAYLIYMEGTPPMNDLDRQLLDIFCLNVSAAFENLHLHHQMDLTRQEMLFLLMEAAETRSKETGHHVRRVGEYSALLGQWYGMSETEVELLRMAAPMHDIGKLGITDNILHKPSRLTEEEFAFMKRHTIIGHDMLSHSGLDVLRAAAIIALQHHEHFDGSGYPNGLSGDGIHLHARITIIADVFDALSSSRSYKIPWTLDHTLEHLRTHSGSHFDPVLIDLFMNHLEEILEVQKSLQDVPPSDTPRFDPNTGVL